MMNNEGESEKKWKRYMKTEPEENKCEDDDNGRKRRMKRKYIWQWNREEDWTMNRQRIWRMKTKTEKDNEMKKLFKKKNMVKEMREKIDWKWSRKTGENSDWWMNVCVIWYGKREDMKCTQRERKSYVESRYQWIKKDEQMKHI